MKKCYKCGRVKDRSEFSTNKNKKDRLNCECKECQKEYFRQYYATKTEKHKQSVKRASSNQCSCGELKRKWAKTCQKCISRRSQAKKEEGVKRENKHGRCKYGRKHGPILLNPDERCPGCSGYKYKMSTLCKKCLQHNPKKVCGCGGKKHIRSMRCVKCTVKNRQAYYPVQERATTELGKKIVEMRMAGFKCREIEEQLNISKSTISYHCSSAVRENHKKRHNRYFRGWRGAIKRRAYSFHYRKRKQKMPPKPNSTHWKKILYSRVHSFHFSRDKGKGIRMGDKLNFTVEDVLNKYGETPVCYLTGRKLDFKDSSSYEFDHILPASKNGPNTLDNLGIACPEANHAKCAMDLEDFIQMCRDVVNHNGDAGD